MYVSYVGKAGYINHAAGAAAGASETAASPADGGLLSPPSAAPVAFSGTETPVSEAPAAAPAA